MSLYGLLQDFKETAIAIGFARANNQDDSKLRSELLNIELEIESLVDDALKGRL